MVFKIREDKILRKKKKQYKNIRSYIYMYVWTKDLKYFIKNFRLSAYKDTSVTEFTDVLWIS